ncbi:MAG: hypothetical protein JWR22_1308 [Herminiimonas sp.]|nr:hypothetical protein [Herminiimonas sp.]
MIAIARIQAALATSQGKPRSGKQLAHAIKVSTVRLQSQMARMVQAGHVSRERMEDAQGRCCFHYHLNARQLKAYRTGASQRDKSRKPPVEIALGATDLPGRLAFLRMLKTKTIFAEHSVLQLIIGDYERTLKVRQAIESRKQ